MIEATSSAVKMSDTRLRAFGTGVPSTRLPGVSISGSCCRYLRACAHFARRRSGESSCLSVPRVTFRSLAEM
jgi:hypothetical protein